MLQRLLESHLGCFDHIKLYNLPVPNTAEEFSRIVLLDSGLRTQISYKTLSPSHHGIMTLEMNLFLPDEQTHLPWYHFCERNNRY